MTRRQTRWAIAGVSLVVSAAAYALYAHTGMMKAWVLCLSCVFLPVLYALGVPVWLGTGLDPKDDAEFDAIERERATYRPLGRPK